MGEVPLCGGHGGCLWVVVFTKAYNYGRAGGTAKHSAAWASEVRRDLVFTNPCTPIYPQRPTVVVGAVRGFLYSPCHPTTGVQEAQRSIRLALTTVYPQDPTIVTGAICEFLYSRKHTE